MYVSVLVSAQAYVVGMCVCAPVCAVCDILPLLPASDTYPQGHKSGQVAIQKD